MIEAQAYLAAIIDSSDDAIVSKDLNGNITSWNHSAERIFGYSEKEAIGKHITMIIPPDRLSEEDYILENIVKGNRIDHFETVRRRKDGSLIDLSVTISPIKNLNGDIIGASKVARDISGVKHAEQISAYYKAIVDSSDDAIISKDLNGNVTSWNRSAERIFGYTADEMVGQHITKIIPTKLHAEENGILGKLKSGERIEHFETKRCHKDGHIIPVSLTVSPILDSEGNIIGASKISRDISERKSMEEKLRKSNKDLEKFAYIVSHDLKSPLRAVKQLTKWLEEDLEEALNEETKELMKTIHARISRMEKMMDDLLAYSRVDTSDQNTTEVVMGDALLKDILALINPPENAAINISPAFSHVKVKRMPLEQVFLNLISNAIKHNDKEKYIISVGCKEEPEHYLFSVEDNGPGIAKEDQKKIFEMFQQLKSRDVTEGSGIGLAIVKKAVKSEGGEIFLTTQPGKSSTFSFTWPRLAPSKP